MFQMMSALDYLHSRGILYLRINQRGLLVSREGNLLFTRTQYVTPFRSPLQPLHRNHFYLLHRPPETILGGPQDPTLSPAAEMWTVGIFFFELLSGSCFHEGESNFSSEVDVLFSTFALLGTPSPATWPEVERFENYSPNFPFFVARNASDRLPDLSGPERDLLDVICFAVPFSLLPAAPPPQP